jgi:hypothetical protein
MAEKGKSRYAAVLAGLLLVVNVAAPLLSQENLEREESVFAPFVSRLTAEVRNNMVRLNWIDSPDVTGPVTVYIADQPIDPEQAPILSSVRPVAVPYGVQFYVDETNNGTRYYFVVASDESGTQYHFAIPFNNTVSIVVADAAQQLAQTPPPEDNVSSLEALVQAGGATGDAHVVISFKTGENDKSMVLYRSIHPLRQRSDLLNAVIVQSGVTSPFVDYPPPGIAYYYAVIPHDALAGGTISLVPNHNATVNAVNVAMAGSVVPDMRPMPLPLIAASSLIPSWVNETAPAALSEGAVQALADVKKMSTEALAKKIRAFKEDMEPPVSGEEYALRSVVQGAFAKKDWAAAREGFLRFLALPRSAAAEAHAHFYLGQVYYFTNLPKAGLFEFLLVKDHYPAEAQDWIDAILVALTR